MTWRELKKLKVEQDDLIVVSWLDAVHSLDEDKDDLRRWIKEGGAPAKTVGFVMHIDDKGILVCCELFKNMSNRDFTYLPIGMIYKVEKAVIMDKEGEE